MNHYSARQRITDYRWDFTCRMGPTRVYAVGYCGGWRELSDDTIAIVYQTRENKHFIAEETRRRLYQSKYHTDGHATRQEACACYREYLLDNQLAVGFMYASSSSCVHCGESTPYAARVSTWMSIPLCRKHNDADHARLHMPDVDEIYEA